MSLNYDLKSDSNNVEVIHIYGAVDEGEVVQPYKIAVRRPSCINVYNSSNKTLKIETAPEMSGPWSEVSSVRRYKNASIEVYSLYLRPKLKTRDQVNAWFTIFRL